MSKPVALIILDGFGFENKTTGNAVKAAKKPNFDKLWENYATTLIGASGEDVGLPDGQMGNSEVGHLNIGAGRVVYQELTRITKAIREGDFFENEALLKAMENAKNSNLHIMGLLSDGGVHSHINHLKGVLELAKKQGVQNVYVHAYMDGRDTAPDSGLGYIKEIEEYMSQNSVGKIATVSGRYYAMDRDNRWERVHKAYDAIVRGQGHKAESAVEAMESSYKDEVLDEFVIPTVITSDNEPIATIKKGDSVIFFNFRPDRAREITRTLVDPNFEGFEREHFDLTFVTMTQYDKTMPNVIVAYKPVSLENTLGQYISGKNKTQLRIAETEKYAHVTFFFNGGREEAYEGEDRILIPSPKVATYDLKPEMSAYEVTEALLKKMEEDPKDLVVLNFANPDMVGHTGVFEAAVKAVETVDECLGRVVEKITSMGGACLISADHGNAEQMIDPSTGGAFTAHTTNKVPFILVKDGDVKLRENGKLCDFAPTILDIMGLEKPAEMSGSSLIIK